MENRNGIITDILITQATGTAEREAAVAMVDRRGGRRRITLGADKAYDTQDFIADLPGTGGDAARRPAHDATSQPDRRARDAAPRVRA